MVTPEQLPANPEELEQLSIELIQEAQDNLAQGKVIDARKKIKRLKDVIDKSSFLSANNRADYAVKTEPVEADIKKTIAELQNGEINEDDETLEYNDNPDKWMNLFDDAQRLWTDDALKAFKDGKITPAELTKLKRRASLLEILADNGPSAPDDTNTAIHASRVQRFTTTSARHIENLKDVEEVVSLPPLESLMAEFTEVTELNELVEYFEDASPPFDAALNDPSVTATATVTDLDYIEARLKEEREDLELLAERIKGGEEIANGLSVSRRAEVLELRDLVRRAKLLEQKFGKYQEKINELRKNIIEREIESVPEITALTTKVTELEERLKVEPPLERDEAQSFIDDLIKTKEAAEAAMNAGLSAGGALEARKDDAEFARILKESTWDRANNVHTQLHDIVFEYDKQAALNFKTEEERTHALEHEIKHALDLSKGLITFQIKGHEVDLAMTDLKLETAVPDKLRKLAKTKAEKDRVEDVIRELAVRVDYHSTVLVLSKVTGASQVSMDNIPSATAIDLDAKGMEWLIRSSPFENHESSVIYKQAMVTQEDGSFAVERVRMTPFGSCLRRLDQALSGRNPIFLNGDPSQEVTVTNFNEKILNLPAVLKGEVPNCTEETAFMAVFFYQNVIIGQSFMNPDRSFVGIPDDIQKTIRMIDYLKYYIQIGRQEFCADMILMLSEYVDSKNQPYVIPALEEYRRDLIARIPDKYTHKGSGGKYNYDGMLGKSFSRSYPTRKAVRITKNGKEKIIPAMRTPSFPTLLHRIRLENGTDSRGRKSVKRTGHDLLVRDPVYGDDVLYEKLPWEQIMLSDNNILGNYLTLLKNSIQPFMKLFFAGPSSVLSDMKKEEEYGKWNKTFEYAVPHFEYIRDSGISSKDISYTMIPKLNFYFMLAYMLWGIRNKAIDIDSARKILQNASTKPIRSEEGEDLNSFITPEDADVIEEIINEPLTNAMQNLTGDLAKLLERPL